MGEIYLANKADVQEGIKDSLLDRLRLAINLAKKTGQKINSLVQWTILDVPPRVGITWYKLGAEPRIPFHLHFGTDEAEELMEVAKTALVMIKLGMEVNIDETQGLISNLTPNLTPSGKNRGLLFFPNLEESSDSGIGDSSPP